MTFNRRVFFGLMLWRPIASTSMPVAVLETFNRTRTTSAILVHQVDEFSRATFSQWLRKNPEARIRVRDQSGNEADATIFRVRMCFGRGLILLDGPVDVHEGDKLTLLVS